LALTHGARGDSFRIGVNAFNIEFVTIGHPDRAADSTGNPNRAGSVPYVYRMSKFEVSEDIITKANSLRSLGMTEYSCWSFKSCSCCGVVECTVTKRVLPRTFVPIAL
jgi:hypothetical protein